MLTITIKGPQGSGKTILAQEIAYYLRTLGIAVEADPNGADLSRRPLPGLPRCIVGAVAIRERQT